MCATVLSNDRILGISYSELWYKNNFEYQKKIILITENIFNIKNYSILLDFKTSIVGIRSTLKNDWLIKCSLWFNFFSHIKNCFSILKRYIKNNKVCLMLNLISIWQVRLYLNWLALLFCLSAICRKLIEVQANPSKIDGGKLNRHTVSVFN